MNDRKISWVAVGVLAGVLVCWALLGVAAENVFLQNATIATSAEETLVASTRDLVWLLRCIAALLFPVAAKFSLELIFRK